MTAIRQSYVLSAPRQGPPIDIQVDIVDQHHPARVGTENFIRQHYALAYGADVRHFLPRLLVLRERDQYVAALGFNEAQDETLYLEHYFDVQVQTALAAKIGVAVPRHALVEVGNLVAARPGGARWLITALTAYLQAAAYEWAVFTAVKALRNAFSRLNVNLLALNSADPARLPPHERAHWGTYYDTDPVVVAASVHQAFSVLHGEPQRDTLETPWHTAYAAGAVARRA